tara:strand:+ start:192 stop:1295 length:1104 start_codon:yes stop_codon:yes gene_type:complete
MLKQLLLLIMILIVEPLFAGQELDSWVERWKIDDVQFIRALNAYKNAKTRAEKVEPAVLLFRAEESLLKSKPDMKKRLTKSQLEILNQARRQFLWIKGATNKYLARLDFFNVHYITKNNDLSIHRLNEAFYPIPENSTCTLSNFKKLAESFHPEFLIEYGRDLKTLVYDYEFLMGESYYKNFQQIISDRKKFYSIPHREEMRSFLESVLVLPVRDNGERIQRRVDKLESQLTKIAKSSKGFVFDQYRSHRHCLSAYPESSYYELLREHQTEYYGEKMLALLQLYVDRHKKLPEKGDRWQILFDFYKARSNRLKDEKEPSQVFLSVIRDGWGKRFKILEDKNKFWVYTEVKKSLGSSTVKRFGPGYLK